MDAETADATAETAALTELDIALTAALTDSLIGEKGDDTDTQGESLEPSVKDRLLPVPLGTPDDLAPSARFMIDDSSADLSSTESLPASRVP
jgi:hypothetical protein